MVQHFNSCVDPRFQSGKVAHLHHAWLGVIFRENSRKIKETDQCRYFS